MAEKSIDTLINLNNSKIINLYSKFSTKGSCVC